MLDGFQFEDGQATGARRGQNVQDPAFTNAGQLHRYIIGQVSIEILSVGPRELQTSYAHGRQLHVPRRWDMIERYFEVCGFSGRQQRG